MLAKNVVKLDNTKVYDQIEKYLTKLSYNSKETERAYRKDIKMFFRIMKEKEIQHLSKDDVQLTLDDFEDFIAKLHSETDENGNKVYQNKTINRKVVCVKGLLRYLAGKKIVEDVSFLSLVNSLPEASNSYGVFETHEVFEIARLMSYEREKGEIKRLAILFALDTAIRKTALLNVKWSNFIEKEDGVLVQVIDKGNKEFRQLISHDFYKELLTIKNGTDKVFDISSDALQDSFHRVLKKMEIEPSRNLTFHSIRKTSVTFRYRISNDILEAQRAANHSNISTTMIYLKHENYGAIGVVSGAGNIDNELYKNVDHETLINAIDGLKKDMKLILNMNIQEMQKGSKSLNKKY